MVMCLTENFFDKKHPGNTKIGQNTQLDMEIQKKEEKFLITFQFFLIPKLVVLTDNHS